MKDSRTEEDFQDLHPLEETDLQPVVAKNLHRGEEWAQLPPLQFLGLRTQPVPAGNHKKGNNAIFLYFFPCELVSMPSFANAVRTMSGCFRPNIQISYLYFIKLNPTGNICLISLVVPMKTVFYLALNFDHR